jgi:putative NIF3 family GTP cyclohydrolase 1 type 2
VDAGHRQAVVEGSDQAFVDLLGVATEGEFVLGIGIVIGIAAGDLAQGGVNDVLIRLLGAEPEQALDAVGCGRVGELPVEMLLSDFLACCKDRLQAKGLRYVDGGRPVRRIAVMGGSGGDAFRDALEKGCDTYVTADVKYHDFLDAAELGLNLIDADHFCTENPVIPVLNDRLQAAFPDVQFTVSKAHHQAISFF